MGDSVWILAAVITGAVLMLTGIAAGARLARGMSALPAFRAGCREDEKQPVPEELQWALSGAEKLGLDEDLSPEAQAVIQRVRGEKPEARPP